MGARETQNVRKGRLGADGTDGPVTQRGTEQTRGRPPSLPSSHKNATNEHSGTPPSSPLSSLHPCASFHLKDLFTQITKREQHIFSLVVSVQTGIYPPGRPLPQYGGDKLHFVHGSRSIDNLFDKQSHLKILLLTSRAFSRITQFSLVEFAQLPRWIHYQQHLLEVTL